MEGKIINIPYSSMSFLFNEKNFGPAFFEIHEPEIARQKRISQLQGLTHPILSSSVQAHQGCFWFTFPHTRFDHAIRMIPVIKSISSVAGYSERFIRKLVLVGLSHDAPTPANGDATMRIDRNRFSEVLNYKDFMIETGIARKWKKKYGFDVNEAHSWVAGEGEGGKLIKAIDWHSYTALDAFYLGSKKPDEIQRLLKNHRFIMDVARDIRVIKDGLYFVDVMRLFRFLKLRALLSAELYFNPKCRKLEQMFSSETEKLLEQKKISAEDLRFKDDAWLNDVVRKEKPHSWCTKPQEADFKRFETEDELNAFCEHNTSVFNREQIKSFKTGLHMLVMHKDKIVPLADALPAHRIDELENLSRKREGWYAYYYN